MDKINNFVNNKIRAVTRNSLRENQIFSIRFSIRSVVDSTIILKIIRFFNKYIYKFGIGASMNRYDNSLTFYSSFKDKKLYKSYSSSKNNANLV